MPSRMTGALKLMLGMFAGGWKFDGRPPGRFGRLPGVCATLMPGGGATPGAAPVVPGGGPKPGLPATGAPGNPP